MFVTFLVPIAMFVTFLVPIAIVSIVFKPKDFSLLIPWFKHKKKDKWQ